MYKSVEIKEPKGKDLDSIYEEMLKDDEEKRKIDCGSCGYDSIKVMQEFMSVYNKSNEDISSIASQTNQLNEQSKELQERVKDL